MTEEIVWEREHDSRRDVLTVKPDGIHFKRVYSGSNYEALVSLDEFAFECGHDLILERFGLRVLDEVRCCIEQRWRSTPRANGKMTSDRIHEIRHELELGPRDDFYGNAEHRWDVIHRPTRSIVMSFEGGDYGNRWTQTKDVRFVEDGVLLVTEGNGKELRVPVR